MQPEENKKTLLESSEQRKLSKLEEIAPKVGRIALIALIALTSLLAIIFYLKLFSLSLNNEGQLSRTFPLVFTTIQLMIDWCNKPFQEIKLIDILIIIFLFRFCTHYGRADTKTPGAQPLWEVWGFFIIPFVIIYGLTYFANLH